MHQKSQYLVYILEHKNTLQLLQFANFKFLFCKIGYWICWERCVMKLLVYENSSETSKLLWPHCESSLYIITTRLMRSTGQANPSCFDFIISWKLMERRWFYFFCPLGLLQGLRSLKHWLLQNLSMKFWTKNSNSSLKNRYLCALTL